MKQDNKIMVKRSKPNTDNGMLSSTRTLIDFFDEAGLSNFPQKDSWRKRLCFTMVNWSRGEEALDLVQFCQQYQIPRTSLYEWAAKYEDVRNALSELRINIGCTRRIGSMKKKLDGTYAYKDMHLYDKEWLAINKYHSDMKKEEDKQPTTFIINTEKPKVQNKP